MNEAESWKAIGQFEALRLNTWVMLPWQDIPRFEPYQTGEWPLAIVVHPPLRPLFLSALPAETPLLATVALKRQDVCWGYGRSVVYVADEDLERFNRQIAALTTVSLLVAVIVCVIRTSKNPMFDR